MKTLAVVAAMAAAVATVSAQGSAIIVNHCEFNTNVWPVDSERNPQSPIVIAPGSSYSEVYHTPSNGGVSLKVSGNDTITIITQFEYTLAGGTIYYDGSNINCSGDDCPFWNWNLYIEASDLTCPGRPCPAQTVCTGFYELPDDVATLACGGTADTILHLCLASSLLPASGDSVSIPAEQPTPTSTPTPTPVPPQINEAPVATHINKRDLGALHRHAHNRRHMHEHQAI